MAGIMLPTAVVMAAKVGVPVVVAIGGRHWIRYAACRFGVAPE